MKEKLIITCEIEDLPQGSMPMSFHVCFVEEKSGIFRLFTNVGWKRVTYRRAVVTNLEAAPLT